MVLVLYVDDEEFLLDICQTFLGKVANITVDIASSVNEGLRLLGRKDYDAIISDYEMPEKNGIDFLKAVRSQGNRVPFIIFTGRGREEIVIEAFNSGADFYLQKGGEPKSQFAELAHKIKMAVERKENERALLHSHSLLKATLEATAEGIIVIGSDGTITTCNQKFIQMWNQPPYTGTLRNEEDYTLLVRGQVTDQAAFDKTLEELQNNPESGSYDIIHCNDGRSFRRYSQVQKIDGRIVGRVWSFRDITGQNRTELELRAAYEQLAATEESLKKNFLELEASTGLLRENEEKYRGVFHADTYPLLLLDLHSLEILDLNDAAASLYGYSHEEMLQLSFYHLSAESTEATGEIRGMVAGTLVHFHRRKDSTTFPVEISGSGFAIGSRSVLIVTVRDTTRTKQIEDALRLSNVKLNLLLGITRHDILNRISVLYGYNEVIRSRISDPPVLELLDRQQKATEAIKKQIDFTREYDQLGIKSPLWHGVDEIAARAYSQILQTISFQCETGNLEIYADPMLEKVFYNLFDNAFRYGNGITRIRIGAIRSGDDLLIIFEDDGTGIPDDEKQRIFARGYGRNTGLGLYLTREILSITGMTISETGEFRKGARFEIRVPEGNFRFLKAVEEPRGYGNEQPIFADD